jgi:hypothetical protein
MSFQVPFFIYSAVDGTPLAGVVPTFQQYRRIGSDGVVTDLTGSAPALLDKSNGLYEFTIPDTDLVAGSIVSYVVDCTPASASRYVSDAIRSTDALAVVNAVTPAVINTFGVDHDAVRRHMFPQWPSFSTKSNPTLATVTEMITEQAATLAGKLNLRSIPSTTSDINSSSTPVAYAWCQQTLKLMVAIAILPSVQGLDPTVVARWKREKTERLDDVEKRGAMALGPDCPTDESEDDPLGVTDFISEYGLTTTDTSDMSSADVPLHRDDDL